MQSISFHFQVLFNCVKFRKLSAGRVVYSNTSGAPCALSGEKAIVVCVDVSVSSCGKFLSLHQPKLYRQVFESIAVSDRVYLFFFSIFFCHSTSEDYAQSADTRAHAHNLYMRANADINKYTNPSTVV